MSNIASIYGNKIVPDNDHRHNNKNVLDQITNVANIKKNPNAANGDIIDTHLTVGFRDGIIGRQSIVTGGTVDNIDSCPNVASGQISAVIGGETNTASGDRSVVLGGYHNTVGGDSSAVVGGSNNVVNSSKWYSVIIGGSSNTISGQISSVIIGGDYNTVDGQYSTVVGGEYNTASNYNSVVIGGCYNTALGSQLKTGHYAKNGTAGALSGTTGDAFIIGNGTGNTARSNAFRVAYNGSVYGMAAFNSTGADYAEYFEWTDSNTDNEDRRGLFVALDGDKIRVANTGDEIIGVISAVPSIMGNAYDDQWQGMYLTDVFGQPLTHTVHHDAEYREIEVHDKDEEGNTLETTHMEQILMYEAHDAKEYIINPDYNPEQEYIPRSQRKEWAVVGMFGQIITTDDGSCTVGGYCTVGTNGIGTSTEDKSIGYKVLKRLDDTHVKILMR